MSREPKRNCTLGAGSRWRVLTNGLSWRVYKVTFAKPIDQELVVDLDFAAMMPRNAKDVESLYLFC